MGFKEIILNSTNHVVVRGSIDSDVASSFIYKLNTLASKDVFVYLDTPGGSVESGNKMLMEIQKYNLSCIADRAYSMGFVLLQGCKNRYIRPYSRIMQHQISYGIQNEKGKIDNYANFIDQIEDELVEMQSSKIGLNKDRFRLRTMNEWWMMGKYAIENNCADEIVDIFCDSKLVKQNETNDFGFYKLTYSKCPLISDPIEIV
tara:strand:- start:3998 stop:4606 length:609 start_codon:yes stop_codon:yes gene_type:complete